MGKIREIYERMSPEKQEEMMQYVESIKEIKKKISEMLKEASVNEIGGPIPVDSMHLNTEADSKAQSIKIDLEYDNSLDDGSAYKFSSLSVLGPDGAVINKENNLYSATETLIGMMGKPANENSKEFRAVQMGLSGDQNDIKKVGDAVSKALRIPVEYTKPFEYTK